MAAKTKAKPISGFCANGQCEGTKPVSPSGKPMRICDQWETCGHHCHTQVTEMYKLAGMDREPPEQSVEYLESIRAERHEFIMPSPDETALDNALSSLGDMFPLPEDEDAARGTLGTEDRTLAAPAPVPAQPVFTPTPTGRRARGQLEYDVLAVCLDFVNDVFDWTDCTPKLVAERIGKVHQIEPPSTGAINAVWDRWEKLGFAEQAKKPSRLVKFTVDNPSAQVLERLKSQVKRQQKRTRAEIKRGSLRPRGR